MGISERFEIHGNYPSLLGEGDKIAPVLRRDAEARLPRADRADRPSDGLRHLDGPAEGVDDVSRGLHGLLYLRSAEIKSSANLSDLQR